MDFRSIGMFKRFDISTDFINNDPAQRNECEEFRQCKSFIEDLVVVNDVAESAVALTQDYIGLVRSEENFQDLLLVSQNF